MFLCVIMDWYSRKILAWSISNTLDAEFCVACLEMALSRHGSPEICNSDQGIQYIRIDFIKVSTTRPLMKSMSLLLQLEEKAKAIKKCQINCTKIGDHFKIKR